MSNTQAKSIALSALNFATVAIVFASKAFLYLCLALYVAGELMFAEYAQSGPVPIEDAIPACPDPLEVEEPAAAGTLAKAIARPGAVLSIPAEAIVTTNHYANLTAGQLRKECSAQNIKWRCAHGPSKHFSKAEMLSALAA